MKKIALITGITGQDGSYLAEFLIEKGYTVHGILRRSSSINTVRIDHIFNNPNLILHYGDLSDSTNLIRLINKIKPCEIYNLAAMSHVKVSFDMPEYVADIDGVGTLRLLEAIRILNMENKVKIYQASTSELYGLVQETPQNEDTPFYPRSPYGVAKLYGFWITKHYREAYNIFACNGILFNHESPRRGETFVTRKITIGITKILNGLEDVLTLGNLDARRDWGHARDYIEMMWMILQTDNAEDWVIATGETYSVRDFVQEAFKVIGVEISFKGSGIDEIGIVKSSTNPKLKVGQKVVNVDKKYFRPTEVDLLLGDPKKAKTKLGWYPKITFKELVSEMITEEIKNFKK